MYCMAGFASMPCAHNFSGAGASIMAAMPRRAGGVRSIFSDERITLAGSGCASPGGGGSGRPVSIISAAGVLTAVFAGWLSDEEGLRAELAACGSDVRRCRCELAATAYSVWGESCFERMPGAYAMAVWDGNRLVLTCDRHGLRQLFFADTGAGIVFSTDMAVLLAHPDVRPERICSALPGGIITWEEGRISHAPPGKGTPEYVSRGKPDALFEELFKASAARFPDANFWIENGEAALREGLLPRLLCQRAPVCRLKIIDSRPGQELPGAKDAAITGDDSALGLLDVVTECGMPDATRAESAGFLLCRKALRVGCEALTAAGGASLFSGTPPVSVARELSRAETIAARAGLTLHPVFADPALMDFAASLSSADRAVIAQKYSLEGAAFPEPDGTAYLHGLRSRLLSSGDRRGAGAGPDEAARLLMTGEIL